MAIKDRIGVCLKDKSSRKDTVIEALELFAAFYSRNTTATGCWERLQLSESGTRLFDALWRPKQRLALGAGNGETIANGVLDEPPRVWIRSSLELHKLIEELRTPSEVSLLTRIH